MRAKPSKVIGRLMKGNTMRFRILSSSIVFAVFATLATPLTPAFAQGQPNSQQEKMKTCNADASAKGLKGDARKTFMSDCLKAKPPATTLNSQQQKMKTCNEQATAQNLKGDARRMFVTSCLKGAP